MAGPPPQAPSPQALVGSAIVFYAVMTLAGLWILGAQDLELTAAIFGDGGALIRDTAIGAGAGLAIVLLGMALRNVGPMKRLNDELSSVLGRPGTGAIALLAVTSAVGEEVFFRGALQPLIGLWPTVIVFGLLHGGTSRKLRAWAVFATAAGALLGWMAEFTGNLLAPILCHLTINYFNLHLLTQEQDEPGPEQD